MQYKYRFVGGPSDGGSESAPHGKRYRKYHGLFRTSEQTAIYEYDRTVVRGNVTERIFAHFATMLPDDAIQFLQRHQDFIDD